MLAGEDQRRAVGVLRVPHRDHQANLGHFDARAIAAAKAALAPPGARQVRDAHVGPPLPVLCLPGLHSFRDFGKQLGALVRPGRGGSQVLEHEDIPANLKIVF